MQLIWAMIVAASSLSAPAFSVGQDAAWAASAVSAFRQQFAAGQYQALYDAGSPTLHNATTPAQFIGVMTAYRAKMGDFISATQIGFENVTTASGAFVEIAYAATYKNGTANEKFLFQNVNGAQALAGFSTTNVQTGH